jgi:HlyD family secretion protein
MNPAFPAPLPADGADSDAPDLEALAVLRGAKRRPLRWFVAGAVALAALGGGGALSLRGDAAAGWETAPLTRGALVHKVTAVGQLEPVERVEVGSDLSGKVASVEVEANDTVTVGDVLARLDPVPYENAVTRARATLASSRASLEQANVTAKAARLDLERTQRLVERGAATPVDVENATLELDGALAAAAGAKAQVDISRASLATAEEDLGKTVITAPITGVVTRRLVDPGQTVVSAMSATALFEVASDLSSLKAEVAVDEADVGRVHADQTAIFTVSAWPDRTFAAAVQTVDLAPVSDESVVTYDADLRLRNDDLTLRPGMTATAEIEVGRLDAVLLVPSAALRFRPDGAVLGEGEWVFQPDGDTLRSVRVNVLGTDGLQTAIESAEPAGAEPDGALDPDAPVVVGGSAS